MQTPVVISIEHLSKNYGTVVGVEDATFQVFQGEVFGFLGPNGAGKTTTIRMLLDLLRPTSGEIEIFGKPLRDNSLKIRRRIGYLPGSFSAYGNLTGRQYLNLCADLRSHPRAFREDMLERLGLNATNLERKIKYLSHGTLQKLGIVQAFFHDPDLLILDEPTIGLDPLMQEEFYKLLFEHQHRGATIFLSSHNLAEVERICHRVAIIREARIEKVDTIDNFRRMLRKKLRIVLAQPMDHVELPGTQMTDQHDLTYEFVITGDIIQVLKKLSTMPLADISLPEPGLEEIFIHFYKDREDA